MSSKIKFIDLFAGIGGIRIGMGDAECVFSSEIDIFARETYKANFNETPSGDITKIPASEIPTFDILLAGFPCQPFSQAGLRKGFDDIRGTLFFEIYRILKHHKPRAALLENVKGLVNHDNGRSLSVIVTMLKSIGYNVFYKVLNAKDFGLPQNRQRIYIVALRDKSSFEFPISSKRPTRLGDILETNVDKKYYLSEKAWDGFLRRKKANLKKNLGFGYRLFNDNSEYTSTLTARYGKDGAEILLRQENSNPRRLTIKECARLQGYPDSFIFPVSNTQAYKQLGNSVAIPVVREVLNAIQLSLHCRQLP